MYKIIFSTLVCFIFNQGWTEDYTKKPADQSFMNQMIKTDQYTKKELINIFENINPQPQAIEAISKPFEEAPWHVYESHFLNQERIKLGLDYWDRHETILNAAEKKYQVPKELIVAILGIESYYGKVKGKYPVLDSLATLAFNYPPRQKFFIQELKEFLLLTKEEKLKLNHLLGSYAGAMGKAQFISSSYRKFAVDFSGDGKRDIIDNDADAIGSVANYFYQHGWKANQPIICEAKARYKINLNLVHKQSKTNPEPNLTIRELSKKGIMPKNTNYFKSIDEKVAIVPFLNKNKQTDVFLAAQNFYVITRYNHSSNYAMAVYKLSEALKKQNLKKG